jgi:hypothetical protein
MKDATKRSIIRWIHIVFSIPILGYKRSAKQDAAANLTRMKTRQGFEV